MRFAFVAFVVLALALACGPPPHPTEPPDPFARLARGDVRVSSSGSVNLASTSQVTGILPIANGGTALATPQQWWSAPVQASRWGTDAGDEGYPVGLVYRFDSAATITGIRYYCTNGGSQLFTVHAATSTAFNGAQTGLATKACTQTAGVINTCTFDTPVSVSDLTKVYTASVYGGSGAADCTFLFTQAPGTVSCGAGASGTCAIGPSIWIAYNATVYGTFNSASSLPANSDLNRIAAAEFVFTIP